MENKISPIFFFRKFFPPIFFNSTRDPRFSYCNFWILESHNIMQEKLHNYIICNKRKITERNAGDYFLFWVTLARDQYYPGPVKGIERLTQKILDPMCTVSTISDVPSKNIYCGWDTELMWLRQRVKLCKSSFVFKMGIRFVGLV